MKQKEICEKCHEEYNPYCHDTGRMCAVCRAEFHEMLKNEKKMCGM